MSDAENPSSPSTTEPKKSGSTMRVSLKRTVGAQFVASNSAGQTALIDGPADLGGQGEGVRPMEMLLMSLAGCSAMDVLLILQKQRQPVVDLAIDVVGQRADAVPAVYTDIHIVFSATGDLDESKLDRAVALSMEKYCSVTKMLEPTVRITHEARIVPSTGDGGATKMR
jgi:putative redox protein